MKPFAPMAAAVFAIAVTAAPALAVVHNGDADPSVTFDGARKAGSTIKTDAYRGKPLYINFFASWCAPCNDEAPAVRGFAAKYAKRGLNIVGVDELENRDAALAFAKKYGWPFPIGIDNDGSVLAKYGSIGLPVHVFIDKSGKISTVRFGEMEAADIEDAIKHIL